MEEGGGDGFDGGGVGGAGFHCNEASSAGQDEEEQFSGEADDYGDLYDDVNVGKGFLQSLPANYVVTDGGFQPPPPPPPPPPLPAVDPREKIQIPGFAGETSTERPAERYVDAGFRGGGEPEAGARIPPPPAGFRADLGQPPGRFGNEGYQRQGGNHGSEGFPRQGGGGGGTTLFVRELHWWTTDAQVEAEVCKYGPVREVRFFDEKVSGRSKGYCQVDFYDPAAAAACKVGMNGHVFNGKPCVVALVSPHGNRRIGESQVSRNQQQARAQSQQPSVGQRGRGGVGAPMGGNYGRGGGSTGWVRGGGMGNRGLMGNTRNRMGPEGGRGILGDGGIMVPPPPMLHPGAILGQGFDPMGYGTTMGRIGGGGYGGFPAGAPAPSFPGMMPSFTPVGAPNVHPVFLGRGMPAGGVGMWSDTNMGGWGGEEQSSYVDDAASDQHYGKGSHMQDRGLDRDRLGVHDRRHDWEEDVGPAQHSSDRRYHDDREVFLDRDQEWERERERELELEREREREKERERIKERERERERAKEREREREKEREREREREKERQREKEKERERERDRERDRDRYRKDKDRNGDHYRLSDRKVSERGRSSRNRSKSREIEQVERKNESDRGRSPRNQSKTHESEQSEHKNELDRGRSSRTRSKSREIEQSERKNEPNRRRSSRARSKSLESEHAKRRRQSPG